MAIGSVNVPGKSYSPATQSAAGLMSAADKTKLDAVNLDTITYDETTHTITVPSTRGTYADGTITFTS